MHLASCRATGGRNGNSEGDGFQKTLREHPEKVDHWTAVFTIPYRSRAGKALWRRLGKLRGPPYLP